MGEFWKKKRGHRSLSLVIPLKWVQMICDVLMQRGRRGTETSGIQPDEGKIKASWKWNDPFIGRLKWSREMRIMPSWIQSTRKGPQHVKHTWGMIKDNHMTKRAATERKGCFLPLGIHETWSLECGCTEDEKNLGSCSSAGLEWFISTKNIETKTANSVWDQLFWTIHSPYYSVLM